MIFTKIYFPLLIMSISCMVGMAEIRKDRFLAGKEALVLNCIDVLSEQDAAVNRMTCARMSLSLEEHSFAYKQENGTCWACREPYSELSGNVTEVEVAGPHLIRGQYNGRDQEYKLIKLKLPFP